MTSLRNFFLAALKSLVRGKSFLQAMLAFWIPSTALQPTGGVERANGVCRSIQDFLKDAEDQLLRPVDEGRLRQFATQFKAQFTEALLMNPTCMLPSYNHQLPSGAESGQYVSLDVGGSTLRVAVVELRAVESGPSESRIVRMSTFKITPDVKSLVGAAFFDWMAARIIETVSQAIEREHSPENPIPMGMSWSFPIEQTSEKGGLLQGMGKGFLAADGLLGQDLGDIIATACQKQGLHVELSAIVNDSAATLLSAAYAHPSTRFGLILGTGVNIAAHLPVGTVGQPKFGNRPASWFQRAGHVIVNTELGMFGKGILPRTRWDTALNNAHPKPDFQPLEHMLSGFYLGEVCRLALVEAIDSTGIFGGVVPADLLLPYSLDTETLSVIEADTTPTLEIGVSTFAARHPSPVPPTSSDVAILRTLASFVSRRSAALVAASVFALWELKSEASTATLPTLNDEKAAETRAEMALPRTTVAFNGSVIEFYPGYLDNCQRYIDGLVGSDGAVDLVLAKESSLLGAAVALACAEEGRAN